MKERLWSIAVSLVLVVPCFIMFSALSANASAEDEEVTTMDTLMPYWTKNFTTAMDTTALTSICNDTNGNLFVCGEGRVKAADAANTDFAIAKFGLDGSQEWNKTWDKIKLGDGGRPRCGADQYGNVYVTGRAQMTPGDTSMTKDIVLIKYDANGKLIWNVTYDNVGLTDFGSGICVDRANEFIYIAGQVKYYGATVCNATLLKYDYNGNLIWVKEWLNPVNERDYFAEPALDAAGNIYVCGYWDSDPRPDPDAYYDGMVVKYDPDGNEKWTASWGGPGVADFHNAIAVDNLNSCLYVCGQNLCNGTGGKYDNMLVKYDLDGNKIWDADWGGAEEDYNYGLAVTDSGDYIYIFGQYLNTADNQIVVTKYDSSGKNIWVKDWGEHTKGQGCSDGLIYNNVIYIAGGCAHPTTGNTVATIMKIDLNGGNGAVMEYSAFILPAGILLALFILIRKSRKK